MSAEVAQPSHLGSSVSLGRARYPLTALALLTRHRPFTARSAPTTRCTNSITHQLYVANGGFHAGRPITADTGLTTGFSWSTRSATPTGSRLALWPTAPPTVTGPRRTLGRRSRSSPCELWLETVPPMALDSTATPRSHPVQITLEANALRVMVPTTFTDT